MRVLVAIDGSEPGDLACALAGNLAWPAETTFRLVTVVPELITTFGGPWMGVVPPNAPDFDEKLVRRQHDMLEAAAGRLAQQGLSVETFVLRGRAASAIVDEATGFGADLLMLGARGHGQWASAFLGSVSAEVVDHAPCPVLIARTTSIERIVLAEDGSEGAAAAHRLLATWPPLTGVPLRVVSVASVPAPWHSGISPLLVEAAEVAYRDSLREAGEHLEEVDRRTAQDLAAGGRDVTMDVLVGDPAREVVRAATEWGASLIAMGSRGRTGVRRLLLGSVARNVLHHAPCSVLIVRAQVAGHVAPTAAAGAPGAHPPV